MKNATITAMAVSLTFMTALFIGTITRHVVISTSPLELTTIQESQIDTYRDPIGETIAQAKGE